MRKSQAAVVSSIIFIVILVMVIALLSENISKLFAEESVYGDLDTSSANVGNLLLSKPFPTNWNETSVLKVGLIDNNVISEDYLLRFANISYPKTKKLLGMRHDYLFYFSKNGSNPESEPLQIKNWTYWGWNGKDTPNGGDLEEAMGIILNNSENLAKSERYVMLEVGGKRFQSVMVVMVWDFVKGEVGMLNFDDDSRFRFKGAIFTENNEYKIGERIELTGLSG